MPDNHTPPFYILLAHSPLSNVPSGALSNILAHPVVQYHYADDNPLSILPAHPNENVLILNYDPTSSQPTVQSISDSLVTTGLRLEEAPGAAADDSKTQRNTSMFIIEMTTNDHLMVASHPDRKALQATLAQFKHRNRMLRRVLEYPMNHPHVQDIEVVEVPETTTQTELPG